MDPIIIVLIMMAAVVVSSWIVRMLPIPVPLPLIQIALGYAITAIGHLGVDLNPHIFMFLFLPPLLFLDGWRIPKEGLAKDVGVIMQLAFGLVFLTVLGVGFLINWIIPAIPLPVAFALAAVISPTDPVAVSAIAAKVPFPKRIMHILEGESLFNDASGLVCLKFALIAALATTVASDPGTASYEFKLSAAAFDFTKMVIGGLFIGVAVTWLTSQLKVQISRRWGEESGTQILISLVIPFVSYMIAELLEFSGVLAAVAAGITMSFSEIRSQVMAATRIRRGAVWDAIQMLANGAMFVLLGEQLPRLVGKMPEIAEFVGHEDSFWLLLYIVIITAALLAIRFIWVAISIQLKLRIADTRGTLAQNAPSSDTTPPVFKHGWVGKFERMQSSIVPFIKNIFPFCVTFFKTSFRPLNSRLAGAMTLAGVRGSITMAAVLSISLSIQSRDLVIFLASGVILLTLIIASVTLPWVLKGLEMPLTHEGNLREKEDLARINAAEEAIKAIEHFQHQIAINSDQPDLYVDAANRIMSTYRSKIQMRQYANATAGNDSDISPETVRKIESIERQMRIRALTAERNAIYQQAKDRLISEETMNKLIREIDLAEFSISS